MKKFIVAMSLAAFAVVGCDNGSSASTDPNNDDPVAESSSAKGDSSSSVKSIK